MQDSTPFATDRINNFTDAIFAIAITLLILDIKVPATEFIDKEGAIGALLSNQTPQLIGLIVSFFVAALFWKAHLALARQITSYDNRLLWLNIWLLFFVVMMPFSTAFYSRNFGYNSAFFFYCVNLALVGFIHYLMTRHVIVKEVLHTKYSELQLRWTRQRALIGPCVFMLSILVAYPSPLMGRITFVLIFVLQAIGDKVVRKKEAAGL